MKISVSPGAIEIISVMVVNITADVIQLNVDCNQKYPVSSGFGWSDQSNDIDIYFYFGERTLHVDRESMDETKLTIADIETGKWKPFVNEERYGFSVALLKQSEEISQELNDKFEELSWYGRN